MIDYSSMLAVGIVLIIGLIPLMSKKLRGGDFLVSYTRPKEHGKEEVRLGVTTPGQDAVEYLHPEPNSELKIITFNFPMQEYDDPTWVGQLKEWHKEGVKIKIVGGPDVEAKKPVDELIKAGVFEAKVLKKSQSYHLAIASPRQLWVEEYHEEGDADGTIFTQEPYEWIWRKANIHFDKLWKKAKALSGN